MVKLGFSTAGLSSINGQPFLKIRVLKIAKMCLIFVRLSKQKLIFCFKHIHFARLWIRANRATELVKLRPIAYVLLHESLRIPPRLL
jgi:hypothetical protein